MDVDFTGNNKIRKRGKKTTAFKQTKSCSIRPLLFYRGSKALMPHSQYYNANSQYNNSRWL